MDTPDKVYQDAARIIEEAEALVICAGAGMGVDSGLPDYRGNEGFWRAYPAAMKLGLSFEELANPEWFRKEPHLAWGFYGHRFHLYRETVPHNGYQMLLRWGESKEHGYFVFTSNVDGQFQKAGFSDDRMVECHGSLMHHQCVKPCCAASWPVPADAKLELNMNTLRAEGELPRCISCGGLARPNVLMFDDDEWTAGRSSAQQIRFRLWLRSLARGKLAVIELGAGCVVPTVRHTAEQVAHAACSPLIRINPREAEGPSTCLSISVGALDALEKISGHMNG